VLQARDGQLGPGLLHHHGAFLAEQPRVFGCPLCGLPLRLCGRACDGGTRAGPASG